MNIIKIIHNFKEDCLYSLLSPSYMGYNNANVGKGLEIQIFPLPPPSSSLSPIPNKLGKKTSFQVHVAKLH
jgi:hypothetical protein